MRGRKARKWGGGGVQEGKEGRREGEGGKGGKNQGELGEISSLFMRNEVGSSKKREKSK